MHFIDKVFPQREKKFFFTALGGLALVCSFLLLPAVVKFILSGLKRVHFPGSAEPGWARFIFANLLFLVQVFFFFLHPACSTLSKWARMMLAFLLLYLLGCVLSPWLTAQYSNSMLQELLKLLATSSLLFLFVVFFHKGSAASNPTFWTALGFMVVSGEAVLGLCQYVFQGDMGLGWLGEKHLECVHPFALIPLDGGARWVFDQGVTLDNNSVHMLRAYGTFDHPNLFGGVLIAGIFLTSHLLLRQNQTKKIKMILTLGLVIQALALVTTFSRSAWLGVVFGVTVLLIARCIRQTGTLKDKCEGLWQSDRVLLKALCISACITLFVFHNQIFQRVSFPEGRVDRVAAHVAQSIQATAVAEKQPALNLEIKLDYERQQYLKMAIAMIERYPMQGVGFDRFVHHINAFSGDLIRDVHHFPVHNIYMLVAAEVGLPAAIFFIGFVIFVGGRILRKPGGEALLGLWVGFIIAGFFDNYFLTSQVGRVLLFIVAGLIFLHRKDKKNSILSTPDASPNQKGIADSILTTRL